MTSVSPGRRAALEILEAVDRGRRLDRALDDAVAGLSDEDRAWAHACAFGTVRLRGRLDHLLDRFLDQGARSVPARILSVLRLGAYQLLYMGGVPDYAALSQSVEQGKEAAGQRMAGLVNGVLRALQRRVGGARGDLSDLFPDASDDPAGHLSTWGSHPRWLVERWLERFGFDDARALVEWNNAPPELYVRPLGKSPPEARDDLSQAGIPSEVVGRGTGCLRVGAGVTPGRVLRATPALVQDPGASLVVEYAAPEAGSRIADLCAAPGGKALALAARAGPGGWVVAADPSAARLALLRESLVRLGGDPRRLAPVYTVVARGEIPPVAEADLVLLDVPCSGTGTLRRHPDGRWRLEPDDVERLTRIQRRILEGAADSVRPGGLLVYSTCSLEPEENEEVVRSFLAADRRFRPAPPTEGDGGRNSTPPAHEFMDEEGFLRVLPHASGFDGAFAARMRRVEG